MDTKISKPLYYNVRRPGCAAWAERRTESEARRDLEHANHVAPGHRIVAVFQDGRAEFVD